MSMYKGRFDERRFFQVVRNYPQIYDLNNYKPMTDERFSFIQCNLDIGLFEKVDTTAKGRGTKRIPVLKNRKPVQIFDLRKKLQPVVLSLNEQFGKYKNPCDDRFFALDECLRKSLSWHDPLRVYLPSKPVKYGEKFFCLCDSDHYLHHFMIQYPPQFASWKGLEGLMTQIVPLRFLGIGCTITADNYYFIVMTHQLSAPLELIDVEKSLERT